MTMLQDVADSYLTTALWAEHNYDSEEDDSVSEHFDGDYSIEDFTKGSKDRACADCDEFLNLLDEVEISEDETLLDCAERLQGLGRIGHDFWLTRNGHGAGFWDGDYEEFGDRITKIVKDNFSECHIFADGRGRVCLE